MEETKKNSRISVERITEILRQNGDELPKHEIETMLETMTKLAKLSINQYFRENNNL